MFKNLCAAAVAVALIPSAVFAYTNVDDIEFPSEYCNFKCTDVEYCGLATTSHQALVSRAMNGRRVNPYKCMPKDPRNPSCQGGCRPGRVCKVKMGAVTGVCVRSSSNRKEDDMEEEEEKDMEEDVKVPFCVAGCGKGTVCEFVDDDQEEAECMEITPDRCDMECSSGTSCQVLPVQIQIFPPPPPEFDCLPE